MPELPEVETMVRGIRPHVEGRVVHSVQRCRCRCKPNLIRPSLRQIRRRLAGSRIQSVHRIAKRVVLQMSTGDALVIEPRMTGLMLVSDPPDRTHLRLQWRFEPDAEHSVHSLWFWDRRGLGTVQLIAGDQLDEHLGSLGVDALQAGIRVWTRQCAGTQRAIKVALLDQKFVAGIGNLYASEILHAAGISPFRPADTLNGRELTRLKNATRRILTTAIRYEGSTLNDGTYRNALNKAGRFQNEHRVYMRAGRRCAKCHRGRIERVVQAQRATFLCPECQK